VPEIGVRVVLSRLPSRSASWYHAFSSLLPKTRKWTAPRTFQETFEEVSAFFVPRSMVTICGTALLDASQYVDAELSFM
jgi:hypothetical protein